MTLQRRGLTILSATEDGTGLAWHTTRSRAVSGGLASCPSGGIYSTIPIMIIMIGPLITIPDRHTPFPIVVGQ